MPYVRDITGKWTTAPDSSTSVPAGPLRLFVVDKQVDLDGTLSRSTRTDVVTLSFDSKITTAAELYAKIQDKHLATGAPFLSIAFANHGPREGETMWTIAKDLQVDLDPSKTAAAIGDLQPLCNVFAGCIEKTAMGPTASKTHIALLACNAAGINDALIPQLETLYHIDFMGSTDVTGNVAAGGNWKMETDEDFNVATVYFDSNKLTKYRQTMDPTRTFVCAALDFCGGGGVFSLGSAALDAAGY
jgi:hypothetical protein